LATSPAPILEPAATETKEVFPLPEGRLLFAAYPSEEVRQMDPDVAGIFAALAYYPWFEEYFWLDFTDMTVEAHPILTGLYPTRDQAVAMSPDLSHIAFERLVHAQPTQASSSVYLSGTNGGESAEIGQRFTGDSVLGTSWSLDSRVFAYWMAQDWQVRSNERDHKIYLSEVDSGTARTVTIQAMQPATAALSPDGTQIAFSVLAESPGMYSINADGSDQHLLVEGAIDWIAWHPDRQRVLFAEFSPKTGIYSYDIASGAITSISPVGQRALRPSLSPDGSLLAYESNGIYVISTEGGKAEQLTGGGLSEWLWSPDSRYLAYTGETQILVMDTLGNGRVAVSPNTLRAIELIGWLPQ
jgi:Tol biopolymer transport system component